MHDAGKVVPAIRDKPSVVGFEWLWEAFHDLHTCRTYGMSPGPIPWTAIDQYAKANEMGVDDSWVLHRVIRKMDSVWLENKMRASASTSQSTKPAKAVIRGGSRGQPAR